MNENDSIVINNTIKSVDFSGVSDYKTLHSIIHEINPDQIICWHGPPKNNDFFYNNLTKENRYAVHVVENHQTLELSSNFNIQKICMKNSLINSKKMVQIGEYEIA